MYETGSSIFTKYRLSEVSICLNSSNDIPIRPTTTFACTRTNFHVRGLLKSRNETSAYMVQWVTKFMQKR